MKKPVPFIGFYPTRFRPFPSCLYYSPFRFAPRAFLRIRRVQKPQRILIDDVVVLRRTHRHPNQVIKTHHVDIEIDASPGYLDKQVVGRLRLAVRRGRQPGGSLGECLRSHVLRKIRLSRPGGFLLLRVLLQEGPEEADAVV